MDLLVGVVSVAMGWRFAWLASKGISFIWRCSSTAPAPTVYIDGERVH